MGEYLTFILSWLVVMALIGLGLFIAAKIGKKKSDGTTVNPETYDVVSPFDIDKKKRLEKIDEHNKNENEPE